VKHYKKQPNKKANAQTVYERIQEVVRKLAIESLTIENGSFIHYTKNGKEKTIRMEDLTIRLTDIRIDSTIHLDKDRFLFYRKAFLSVKNFTTTTTDEVYRLKVAAIAIEAPRHLMTIEGFTLSSRYKR
jgi:hypothetical protein